MEVCRACQKPIKQNDEFIIGITGWKTTRTNGTYHLECFKKEHKKGTIFWICFPIVLIIITVSIPLIILL